MAEPNFMVIVVGGSIAGLTLAHCLDKADIGYLVIERNERISPQVGASIGIMPNGARVLDQLELFNTVESEIEPLDKSHICYPDDFSFTSSFPTLLNERHGYPVAFLERKLFLDILYNGLPDKSKVHLGKEVVEVQQLDSTMRVITKDGCSYEGDLIVGADGVHSSIRSEMWRIADTLEPGLITQSEKNAMFAEYICVYGISSAIPGLVAGEQVTRFYNGLSILTFHGKGGRVFWFVLQKMDKKHYYPEVPHFTDIDAERLCLKLQDKEIWKGIFFSHIWARRKICSMVAVEENVFRHWHHGRIVCLGDSMHKMTPNFGQGANSAIESAAALANTLFELVDHRHVQRPSNTEINAAMTRFVQSRLERTASMVKTAGFVTRLQARDGLVNRLIGRYVAPYAGDLPADMSSNAIVGATKLDYITLPERSSTSYMQACGSINWPRRISMTAVFLGLALLVIWVSSTWQR